MNDGPEGNDDRESMCDNRSQNDLLPVSIHAKAKNNRAKAGKISEIKTDRRSQETITVNRHEILVNIIAVFNLKE